MTIWIVIPAYNEEKQIGRVIAGLFEHGWHNVVVVDDNSSDNTIVVARKSGALVVHHVLNRGQGAALRTGDELALAMGADVIVHFDGDEQFDPGDVKGAVDYLQEKGLGAVLGSKMLDNRSQIPWLKKLLIIPISRVINLMLTGAWLSDAHNGFRVLTRATAEKIIITQDGMAHNSEIIGKIKKNGIKFAEFSVKVVYNEYGQGVGGGVKILRDWILSVFIR